MNRRSFLFKSAYLAAGSLLGMNSFSKAFAFDGHRGSSFFQPRIALIIDDIGYSFARARWFLELDIPITFSILPRLTHSQALAVEIHGYGHEVMLHQPMQPYNSHLDPGPGALYEGYDPWKISSIIEENISDVPLAIGVNNHMGSRFTECQKEINETLKVIKNNDLFFIDSLTSHDSKAYKTARRLNITAGRRNVFLDNSRNELSILFQLHLLKKYALKYGHAIGIGHPFPETARAIGYFLRGLKDSDISFVHISEILYT